jgi:hypothetical protein
MTLDPDLAAQVKKLCLEFDAARQAVLEGGTRPALETYVACIASTGRPILQRELEKIQRSYEIRVIYKSLEVGF